MISNDPARLELRSRMLDVFDDLRRAGLAFHPREMRMHTRATHLTFVQAGDSSAAFVAFFPVRADLAAEAMAQACELRGVSCEWEGAGHLVIVSPSNTRSEAS